MEALRPAKSHRAKKSGVKADKKKAASKKKRGLSTKKDNPRAFGVANVVRTKRTQQRNMDRSQKKEVVPLTDRTVDDAPPPVFVVVMGPSGVGKTTLIRSLVKIYSGQNLTDSKGPITVICGRKRRVTLFECPSDDICAMTDLAKVADLVLLMIDASYGFEMETFEFLNQLQLHGFPKVIGVLTHLDQFKANKQLQNTKKALKNRFWTEIYKGAKLFDLSGVVHGKYPKGEVKRLSLYISRVKFRPLVWRNTHPYVVVDRVEDITGSSGDSSSGAPSEDRDIALYGYVRGTNLKQNMRIHLIGAGDFDIYSMTALEDPCPMEVQQRASEKKSLKDKDTKLFAPMSNIGRVQMETDGVYINIKNIHYTKPEHLQLGEGAEASSFKEFPLAGPASLLRSLQDTRAGVDKQMEAAELSLFAGSKGVKSKSVSASAVDAEHDEYDDEDDDDDEEEDDDEENDEDEDDEDEDEEGDDEGSFEGMDEEGGDFGEQEDEEQSEDDEEEDEDDDEDEDNDDEEDDEDGNGFDYDYENEEDEEEEEEEEEEESKMQKSSSSFAWKDSMKEKASAAFQARASGAGAAEDLMTSVYGFNLAHAGGILDQVSSTGAADDADSDSDDGELFVAKSAKSDYVKKYEEDNRLDSSRESLLSSDAFSSGAPSSSSSSSSIAGLDIISRIRFKFVTNKDSWKAGSSSAHEHEQEDEEGEQDEVYGAFEDLQTGEKFGGGRGDEDDEEEDDDDEDAESVDSEAIEASNDAIDKQLREQNALKKSGAKSQFDLEYDGGKQAEGDGDDDDEEGMEEGEYVAAQRRLQEELRARNRMEFGEDGEQARLQLEGFRQGIYVRMVLRRVPVEFTASFRPQNPVIVGGLLPHETALGFIRARVKRHRWHKRVLKSNDPLIFSIGWRRFQSMPVYTMEDQNDRLRFIKYTPEHMHCICTFYGPLVPPNTGILAFQTTSQKTTNFRISLTGTALELQASTGVVKKLKLVGHPSKVFKHTAFIEGMFNSSLEVSKFIGAKIKTVSGIRGSIKRALKDGKPGTFRAAFEDKPLMSDIVICRLWVPVEIKKLYNPVNTLLDSDWRGVRTVAQIRREDLVPQVVNKDSLYQPIERQQRVFSKLTIPAKLQAELPFASKPKQQAVLNRKSYMARRAVALEPEERKDRAAVQMLQTISKDKKAKRQAANVVRKQKSDKAAAKKAEIFAADAKFEKKRKYTEKGKADARKKAKTT